MGILAVTAMRLMEEGLKQPFQGKVLQLGRQDIHFNYEGLQLIARNVGFQLSPLKAAFDPAARLTDQLFFMSLGFSQVESMEYGTCEGATYSHDLNEPVPEAWFEKFDAIYDGGTCEHVFHMPNCLSSICSMLKVGGKIMHEGAISGTIDHGFYAIQPTLFNDYYFAQGFQIHTSEITSLNKDFRFTHFVMDRQSYVPGMYDFEKTWATHPTDCFVLFFSATKTQGFTSAVMPQQSLWLRHAAAKG